MTGNDDKTVTSSRGRVIVVDGDAEQRRLMTLRLEENLFDVRGYATGDDCLAKAADFDPDVILVNITMAGGIETCRRLKQVPALKTVPVVFVTGRDDDQTTIEALAAGGSDFLSNNASQPVMIARLSSQIALNRTQRQIRNLAPQGV
ncbi:MAG: response regulator [Deltaproteobacteria bacterium]|nr:response regulator [Deltaproteobacteria bacterium]